MPEKLFILDDGDGYQRQVTIKTPWPWDAPEPEEQTIPNGIRQLEKAGALIAAEIDRLLRLEGK